MSNDLRRHWSRKAGQKVCAWLVYSLVWTAVSLGEGCSWYAWVPVLGDSACAGTWTWAKAGLVLIVADQIVALTFVPVPDDAEPEAAAMELPTRPA
ncbi:hypothetical protein CC80DRAFT_588106 [Byssothecium circinans]|uniref:Uncharacterized protein n=1 Tax=Byssothecium circinans TaxID=147558 RepID=A0A6A5UFS7_9PLEO|nr:hypothetical protein CC80DRAFT_588106 [Byssothecium circinans]